MANFDFDSFAWIGLDSQQGLSHFGISNTEEFQLPYENLKPIHLMSGGLESGEDLNNVYGSYQSPKWYWVHEADQTDKALINAIKERAEAIRKDQELYMSTFLR